MSTSPSPSPHELIGAIEDRGSIDFARCHGRLDLFFEPFRELAQQRVAREQAAKRVCDQCPVQSPCRDSGRRNHESGIWGGEIEEERVRAGFPIRSVARSSVMTAHRSATTDQRHPPAHDPEVARMSGDALARVGGPGEPRTEVGFGRYQVWIDQDLCTGDGICVDYCPDVFVLLDGGIAVESQTWEQAGRHFVGLPDRDLSNATNHPQRPPQVSSRHFQGTPRAATPGLFSHGEASVVPRLPLGVTANLQMLAVRAG